MYAYIDSFRKFGKTNTDNQSIKIKRPYPMSGILPFFVPCGAGPGAGGCRAFVDADRAGGGGGRCGVGLGHEPTHCRLGVAGWCTGGGIERGGGDVDRLARFGRKRSCGIRRPCPTVACGEGNGKIRPATAKIGPFDTKLAQFTLSLRPVFAPYRQTYP